MSTLDDDAALRYILDHVKSVVQTEDDGVPIIRLQRQLAQLPAGTLGRFEPSVDSIRLAIRKFPDVVYISPDRRVHSCANASTTPRTAPPVNPPNKPPVQNTLTSGSSAKITAEGKITAIKDRNYGFIVTDHPVQYSVFYHLSATSGWPPGSQGPKVGDPVEIELERGPPGHKCKYIAKAVRYAGSIAAGAQEPRGANDQRVISDRVGVITFISPDSGTIKFGDGDGETAFFDKRSLPKSLLRRGETLMDVFSAGEKVCFEAQSCLKGDRRGEWYATLVTTVQRGSRSAVFDDGDLVRFAQSETAIGERSDKAPPGTALASQPTRSGCWGGADSATSEEQRQGYAAPHQVNLEAQPSRKQDDVVRDSSMEPTQYRPASEAQVLERRSQRPPEASVPSREPRSGPSREQAETSGGATGGGPQFGGRGFNVEATHQLAGIIESTLMEMLREELTLVLSEELGLTAEDLQMKKTEDV